MLCCEQNCEFWHNECRDKQCNKFDKASIKLIFTRHGAYFYSYSYQSLSLQKILTILQNGTLLFIAVVRGKL